MIEVTLRDYLLDALKDIPVLFEKPKQVPEKYVIMRDIDAGIVNHISAVTISFTMGAKSFYEAKVLSNQVKNIILNSITLPEVSSAKLGGENGAAVPKETTYEYELIFNFFYFEEE